VTLPRRVAGAPITWGVSEVPGWGYQLAAARVLAEAAALGFRALELGPPGFLPADPTAARALLARHGLGLAGAFVATVLHRGDRRAEALAEVERAATFLSAAGGGVLNLAAALDVDGYEASRGLDDAEWAALLGLLDAARAAASARGVEFAFHPHHGTAVATPAEVDRVLAGSTVDLCLDTGHLLVGGADPVAVARRAAGRVGHAHLKDADAGLAARVRRGELGYHAAVALGLYRPLGEGDLDVRGVLDALDAAGYAGWLVLEQDTVLRDAPGPGDGPAAAARRSLQYLNGAIP
jgi:inosose dehydratase